jgi:hypothetical protein
MHELEVKFVSTPSAGMLIPPACLKRERSLSTDPMLRSLRLAAATVPL